MIYQMSSQLYWNLRRMLEDEQPRKVIHHRDAVAYIIDYVNATFGLRQPVTELKIQEPR